MLRPRDWAAPQRHTTTMSPTSIDDLPIDLQGTARRVTAVLAPEFVGVVGLAAVERLVVESFAHVLPGDDLHSLGAQVEAAARGLLLAAASARPDLATPRVVFLCVQNAGRSQIAAAWADQLSGGLVDAESAGSAPADGVHPNVVAVMAEVGIDLSRNRPTPWTDELIGSADVVVTMGCGDACPVLPGVRYLDWDVADPSGVDVDAVRAVRDDLRARVGALLDELARPPE